MIICPNCKEEIDGDSHYCDQCGQALLYCKSCGRVGMGRRCTQCGGLMVSPGENNSPAAPAQPAQAPATHTSRRLPSQPDSNGQPTTIVLSNRNLNIHIVGINGAIIGRRQGPYAQFFSQNMYISGMHAQLFWHDGTGWTIVDRNSSNGTKLNQHPLQPDVEMAVNNGDIITLANINLEVTIS